MASAPQLPPRTYPRSPLALYQTPAVTVPVPAYERYRVLLAFFRRLSFTLTLAGSGTAVIVYVWRKYFLPRWIETNEARSKVAKHQDEAWAEVVGLMKESARRGRGLALKVVDQSGEKGATEEKEEEGVDGEVGEKAEGETRLIQAAEDDEEILDLSEPEPAPPTTTPTDSKPSDEAQDPSQPPTDEPPRSPRPAPLDLSALEHVDEYAKKGVQLANKNALPASSKAASALLTSLSSFNADIQTQTFLALDSSRSRFLPSSSMMDAASKLNSSSTTQQQQQKTSSELAQIKAEIRSLKGLLLSRRNFGYARPTTSVQ
ncbi:hypothetical protein V8E36_001511 [Tilletia maclaganii]